MSKKDYEDGYEEGKKNREIGGAEGGISQGIGSLNPFANDDYRKGFEDGFNGDYDPPEEDKLF